MAGAGLVFGTLVIVAGCGSVKSPSDPDGGAGGVTLTVTRDGNGSGTVDSAPAGISCGSTCSASFDQGTSVTLTATSAGDSSFSGWGGPCSGTGPCTVTLDQATTVTATFARNTRTLTVTVEGPGAGSVTSTPGSISCPGTCVGDFELGSTVTLVAAPTGGDVFVGWTGACTGTQPTCAVMMTDARATTARFAPAFCATGMLDRFDAPDSTTIAGFTEQLGDWEIATNRVRHNATGGVYTHYMTRDASSQTDGCASVTAVATPPNGSTIQAVGVVLRWTSPSNYVVGLVQDNTNSGAFNTLYIYQYPGGTSLGTLGGQTLGMTPRVQMCIQGNAVTLRADVDNDGTFEATATGTTTLAGAGLAGIMTHTFSSQAFADDFCVGQ